MNRKILAVCDSDTDYLQMLQSYFLKKSPAGFEVLTFNSIKQAALESKEDDFEILLVGEGIYDKSVQDIDAQKIFILQENGLSGIADFAAVQKYQSMESLMSQVLDAFASDEKCKSRVRMENKAQGAAGLISFYSPDRHKGQSIAALAAAQALADMGNKVLYISMQPFSGFEQIFGTKYEADVTDFVYFALRQQDKLLYKLEGIKRTVHGVDYLPPALDFADLTGIAADEWEQWIAVLLNSGVYTHIVADLTEACQGFYSLLEGSDAAYILSAEDAVSKAMYGQFLKVISQKGMSARHMKKFNLARGWENGVSDMGQLFATPVGAQMKGIMAQNG